MNKTEVKELTHTTVTSKYTGYIKQTTHNQTYKISENKTFIKKCNIYFCTHCKMLAVSMTMQQQTMYLSNGHTMLEYTSTKHAS